MRKLFAALMIGTAFLPAMADPAVRGWKTYDALGCMLLRECTDDTQRITSVEQLEEVYTHSNFDLVKEELDEMLAYFEELDIEVYLSDEKYFPPGHRGTYHTVSNNFFLNKDYMDDPYTLLEVMRHEGWHAAQDCMAGTLDNNNIAIIRMPDTIPRQYHLATEIAYAHQPGAIPWETEAKWAGSTPDVTNEALAACTTGAPWDVLEPTPKTREWLVREGYIG